MTNNKKKTNFVKSKTNPIGQIMAIRKKEALKTSSHRGEVYRGVTKYIDVETKPERNYVVVADNGKYISVSKLKSIKKFDDNGRNADPALLEIDNVKYGLPKRTGIDFQQFYLNRMSNRRLSLSDHRVFPYEKPVFKLGSHDLHNVLLHVKKTRKY